LVNPVELAFDASGNLWVSTQQAVVELAAATLGTSGPATPTVMLSGAGGSLVPYGLAFDGHGNLWVANDFNGTLVEYTPSQLAAGGTLTPAVTISSNSGSLADPKGVAFDGHGDLWVSNFSTNKLVEFTPTQLSAGGSPVPAVTLNTPSPFGLAFDESGNLWITNANGQIDQFAANQLTTSGSPTPSVVVSGGSLSAVGPGLAFDPRAGNLPLFGDRVAGRKRLSRRL
jgi:streptogramin lyase